MKKTAGHIYIFRCGIYYKIGCTNQSVQHRLKAAQHGNPYEITIVHAATSDDIYRAEKFLHLKFGAKRIRNEWFELSSDDVAWLLRIANISSEYLDRYDTSVHKAPARDDVIDLSCLECGAVFTAERKQIKQRKYCSDACSRRRTGRASYERYKAEGKISQWRSERAQRSDGGDLPF